MHHTTNQDYPRLIVLPLVPAQGQAFDGIGLGIHFFLGNLFAVHPKLTECWFGWRIKKIFTDPAAFTGYCRNKSFLPDIVSLGRQEKVGYWLEGEFDKQEKTIQVSLVLHDIDGPDYKTTLPMTLEDGLLDFRHRFFDWLDTVGLGFSQTDATLWFEHITARGFDCLGRALETLYLKYITKTGPAVDTIDLHWFEQAVKAAPDAYLAHDLMGWGHYKNQAIGSARGSFETALSLNKNGVGAVSGLLGCAVAEKNRKKALFHALEKAGITGTDPAKAAAAVDKKFAD